MLIYYKIIKKKYKALERGNGDYYNSLPDNMFLFKYAVNGRTIGFVTSVEVACSLFFLARQRIISE
jgi:hypothetical protein